MLPIFAMEVDLVSLGALLFTLLSSLATLAGGFWKGMSVFWAWFKDKINPVIDAHRTTVITMNQELPLVRQAMQQNAGAVEALKETSNALKETQINQCKTLETHSELLRGVPEILKDVRSELKRFNDSTKLPPQ